MTAVTPAIPSISKLLVEQYAGVRAPQTLAFAKPNGKNGSGLTVLVGPNNSGKSTILECLRLASWDTEPPIDREIRHPGYPMRIELWNSEGELRALTTIDQSSVSKRLGSGVYPSLDHIRFVPSRRTWKARGSEKGLASKDYWRETNKLSKEAEDSALVRRLTELVRSGEKSSFDKHLKKILPEVNLWNVDYTNGQQVIDYKALTGERHIASMLGDGVAGAFRIAVALFELEPGQIVILDEPELSLHPSAQANLAKIVSEVSSKHQVIIATHSPKFTRWADFENGAELARFNYEDPGIIVRQIPSSTLTSVLKLGKNWQTPHLLDDVARELFFAKEAVFVEGQEDVGLLQKFAMETGRDFLPLFGYGSGGASNIGTFLELAGELAIRSAAIYDGDKSSDAMKSKNDFPDALIEVLPTPDIRDKHDPANPNLVVKEGVFTSSGQLKSKYQKQIAQIYDKVLGFIQI